MRSLVIILMSLFLVTANASSVSGKDANFERKVPTAEMMKNSHDQFIRYCSACHGKKGQGRGAPSLRGNLIATGPIGAHIHMVLTGTQHTDMPSWGLTELSDEAIADVITYVRNAWGNNDKKKYGKHAGGVVTPDLIKRYREALKNHTVRKNVRI